MIRKDIASITVGYPSITTRTMRLVFQYGMSSLGLTTIQGRMNFHLQAFAMEPDVRTFAEGVILPFREWSRMIRDRSGAIEMQVQEGKSYLWCGCGRSRKQRFCDGSRRGTRIKPLVYRKIIQTHRRESQGAVCTQEVTAGASHDVRSR